MTTDVRVSELPQLITSHSVRLVGDSGGRSLITGEVYESGVHAGMSAIETEHGTIYLETNHTIEIEIDVDSADAGMLRYGFFDFTEDESTDAIPNKRILEIVELEYDDGGLVTGGDEIAVIVHRVTAGIDNEQLMNTKRTRAQLIVDALNAADSTR